MSSSSVDLTTFPRLHNLPAESPAAVSTSPLHNQPPSPSTSFTGKNVHFNISRVSQLDASLLDLELFEVLKNQAYDIFSLFGQNTVRRFEPEIAAIIRGIVYALSVNLMDASYGAQLQNLRYRNERHHLSSDELSMRDSPLSQHQKIVYGLSSVIIPWGWSRVTQFMSLCHWGDAENWNLKRRIWNLMQRMEVGYKILSLVNFLAFLLNGRYRSLLDRLLRMRLVYNRRHSIRQINFEFMNRQLVWHGFTEFLLFLMPLINTEWIKNRIRRTFSRQTGEKLSPDLCAICFARNPNESCTVCNGYRTNCGHIFCYYCIKTALNADPSYPCPRCLHKVVSIEPYAPIVES